MVEEKTLPRLLARVQEEGRGLPHAGYLLKTWLARD